jgi:threonine dehydratase
MAGKQEAVIRPVADVVRPTSFIVAARLNQRTKIDITFASETFQTTGSFKFRAAYNLASNVPHERIITASSGNFGQALAYACRLLGKRCTVVMPDNSAAVKVEAVREFGGVVDMVATRQKSRAARVAELAAADPDAYVASAYDDDLVISGNATLGHELAAHAPQFDAVLVPIGGGGLSAGVLKGLRESGNQDTAVWGVEPVIANDCARSLRAGTIQTNDSEPQTIADGVRTISVGKQNWRYLQNGLAGVIEVTEESILESLRLMFSLANLKAEPTGALSLAGAISAAQRFAGKKICCIVSGGNVDAGVFHDIICAH